MDVADAFQFFGDDFRILQSRQEDQAVYFTNLIHFFINRTDLTCNDKTRLHGCGRCGVLYSVFFLQHIQPILRRFQFFLEFLSPGRMREVACANYLYSFSARPEVKMFRGAVFAGGTGIAGVDVQICDVHYFITLSFLMLYGNCDYHVSVSITFYR